MDDIIYEDESAVREQVVQFYKKLYWGPNADGLEFASIDENERQFLEGKFAKEEVIQVLKEMKGYKDPGLDGFTRAFFQKVLEGG